MKNIKKSGAAGRFCRQTARETGKESAGKNNAAETVKTDEERVKKQGVRKKVLAIIAAALGAVIIALAGAAVFDYTIVSRGIKSACRPKKISEPKNYGNAVKETKMGKDIRYGEGKLCLLDIISPDLSQKAPLVLYAHGGYYIGGDKISAEPYCRVLAQKGYVVANINYDLAPKAKYPTQLRELNEALAFLKDHADEYGIDDEQIFLAGDSAGCHLVAQAGAFYTNAELRSKFNFSPAIPENSLKGLLLLCGFYNASTVRQCKFPFMPTAMWALTDVKKFENYSKIDELSVVKWVTPSYPSSFVLCGGADPFYSQAAEMIGALKENGVDVFEYLPSGSKELKHEFQRNFSLEEAEVGLGKAIEFLDEHCKKTVFAVFTFDTGDVLKAELYPQKAPKTVENFIRYAKDGFYNGTAIHRIIPDKMIQGGGRTYAYENEGYVYKKPTYPPIKGEFKNNGYGKNDLKHVRGTISMARGDDMDSATSEFFLCSEESPSWNDSYAAFGKIVGEESLAALDRLAKSGIGPKDPYVGGGEPLEPLILLKVEIKESAE